MQHIDNIRERMKTFYENISKTQLTRRTPVIIRLDGKAFRTFTSGLKHPFDDVLTSCMQETAKYLCEHIQGCVLAYTQSDEISLLLIDYQHHDSCAWYDNAVQKMCSVSASMATLAFNRAFDKAAKAAMDDALDNKDEKHCAGLKKALTLGGTFDSRVFNIPREEVTNYFYWRQLDASRNSIQMVGQSQFSHKELKGKTNSEVQDMLMLQKGINWNDFPTQNKRGSCVLHGENGKWMIDTEIPLFKSEGREYIERLLVPSE